MTGTFGQRGASMRTHIVVRLDRMLVDPYHDDRLVADFR